MNYTCWRFAVLPFCRFAVLLLALLRIDMKYEPVCASFSFRDAKVEAMAASVFVDVVVQGRTINV
jgi:hypothetical protein